jgi:putative DNA primase/helicase
MNKIAELAKGQWFHLLTGLGISAEYLQNKHGPCPICGGKDRFRWDNRRHMGDYFCTQCGSGDGFDLAMKVTGRTFRDIATEFTKLLGPSYIPPKDSQQASKEYNAIKTLWNRAQRPLQEGPFTSLTVSKNEDRAVRCGF